MFYRSFRLLSGTMVTVIVKQSKVMADIFYGYRLTTDRVKRTFKMLLFSFQVSLVKNNQVPQRAENKLKDLTKSIFSGIIQSMLYNTHLNSILTKSFRCFGHLSDYEALVAGKQLRLCGGAFYFYLIIIPHLFPFVNLFLEK